MLAARTPWRVLALAACCFGSGCSANVSRLTVTDFRDPGEGKRYTETFDEAYYSLDDDGNLIAVLRRLPDGHSDPSEAITQVVRLETFWRPIPGRTVAHRTQINATVSYYILVGQTGATFEGSGSVFFDEDREEGTLEGSLDLAVLHPKRERIVGGDLFKRAELSGRFHAVRNPRRVTDISNDLNRLFGISRPD